MDAEKSYQGFFDQKNCYFKFEFETNLLKKCYFRIVSWKFLFSPIPLLLLWGTLIFFKLFFCFKMAHLLSFSRSGPVGGGGSAWVAIPYRGCHPLFLYNEKIISSFYAKYGEEYYKGVLYPEVVKLYNKLTNKFS